MLAAGALESQGPRAQSCFGRAYATAGPFAGAPARRMAIDRRPSTLSCHFGTVGPAFGAPDGN